MLSRVIEMYSKQPYMISYSDSNTQYVIRKDMNMEVNNIRRLDIYPTYVTQRDNCQNSCSVNILTHDI